MVRKKTKFLVALIILFGLTIGGFLVNRFSRLKVKQEIVSPEVEESYHKLYKTHFGGGGLESEDFVAMKELGVHFKRLGAGISPLDVKNLNIWDKQLKEAQEANVWFMGIVDPLRIPFMNWPSASQFASKFKEIVERYDGDGYKDVEGLKYPIKYYELCNEIELGPRAAQLGWLGNRWEGFTFEMYLELYLESYKAMKEACPDCQLAPGSVVDGRLTDAFKYLVSQGAKDKIDFISYHSYQEYLDVDTLMRSLKNLGLDDRLIFLTESQFGGTMEKLPFTQKKIAEIQTRSYVYALAKGIDKVMPAELSALPQFPEGLKWSCLIDENGRKRPSFYAYKTLISKLDFFSQVREIEKYQYEFTVGSKKVYVLWGKGPLSREINGRVKITMIDGNEKEMDASQIILTDAPIFVELVR